HYSVPMSLVQRSAAIPTAFGRTLFPRLSSLSGDAAHALGTRALSMMAFGFGAICAPAIILSHTFFRYWIGADFAAPAAPVAQLLFPGMWMAALSLVGFTLLQSQGRADLTGKVAIIDALPCIAIFWILTTTFGIVGAAAAWTVRCGVETIVILWLAGMKRGDFLRLLPPPALLAASLIVARVLGSNPAITFPVAVFMGAMSFFLGYSISEDWRSLTLAQINRARVFLSNLTNRVRRSPSVKTSVQK
ncbi:MAG: polysaccharide biosynthesis C-terminal domain-containing protein, partial [Candidatus Acidiferrum sp.]